MAKEALEQPVRLMLLLLEVAMLCAASALALGNPFPAPDDRSLWFYVVLLGLLLGKRLDTPFFAKPHDVFLYAVPATLVLLTQASGRLWVQSERIVFWAALGACVTIALSSAIAILTVGSRRPRLARVSQVSRVVAEVIGTPRIVYSILLFFVLFIYHRNSATELAVIVSCWVATVAFQPLEAAVFLWRRVRRVLKSGVVVAAVGSVEQYQSPGLATLTCTPGRRTLPGQFIGINDEFYGAILGRVIDDAGRTESARSRVLLLPEVHLEGSLAEAVLALPRSAACAFEEGRLPPTALAAAVSSSATIGVVAPESNIFSLNIEVIPGTGLVEGRLIEAPVGARRVLYQVVNGTTKEEQVGGGSTRGYWQARAQKIGEWSPEENRFRRVPWLPRPNECVQLKGVEAAVPRAGAVGFLPDTNFGIELRSLDSLVTHNTAILGILGVGKSTLALELVERLLRHGVNVLVLDLTNQYATELAAFHRPSMATRIVGWLNAAARATNTKVSKNVEQGGGAPAFSKRVRRLLKGFMRQESGRLLILNPSSFRVWRQDSKPYQETASMALLTPAEITRIFSEAALEACGLLGMAEKARLCLVYEEAHSLIPEWNSAVAEGDRQASNGTARAILHGRKFGLGCLLITQRTANVTKTILNQCNTVFAMRTFDDTGKEYLANYFGAEHAALLSSLEERHAVLFGRASSCENPVMIRLNDRANFVAAFRTPAALQR